MVRRSRAHFGSRGDAQEPDGQRAAQKLIRSRHRRPRLYRGVSSGTVTVVIPTPPTQSTIPSATLPPRARHQAQPRMPLARGSGATQDGCTPPQRALRLRGDPPARRRPGRLLAALHAEGKRRSRRWFLGAKRRSPSRHGEMRWQRMAVGDRPSWSFRTARGHRLSGRITTVRCASGYLRPLSCRAALAELSPRTQAWVGAGRASPWFRRS